jgi:hypothetical protein
VEGNSTDSDDSGEREEWEEVWEGTSIR